MKIGFIGQGWIGKHYADDFETRGYDVIRYSLEEPYIRNRELITSCEIVFVAVPTPTTEEGFVDTHVRSALAGIAPGTTVVVKSTLLPGTTERLQNDFPKLYVMHSPEFLVEKTAAYDASHPNRNIIGIPKDTPEYRSRAQKVLDVLPNAPYERVMAARDAEFVKYAGNCFLFTKVIFMNLLYDAVQARGGDWNDIKSAVVHDPRIGMSHAEPIHDGGRGAGGDCFIKDFEAFRRMYEEATRDPLGTHILTVLAEKNIALLVGSGKSMELLRGVYGDISKYVTSKESSMVF